MGPSTSIARTATWSFLVLSALLGAGYSWVARRVPSAPALQAEIPAPLPWPTPVAESTSVWSVLQGSSSGTTATEANPLAARFRLAGTFFIYAVDGNPDDNSRCAIIDALAANQQSIVREGDRLEEFEVVQVLPDRVRLRSAQGEVVLLLSYADTAPQLAVAAPAAEPKPVAMEDMPALETSRFGKRVGENRWVFRREELLAYYREVLDEPERIAALYTSLKPDYQDTEIAGYRLGTDGEAEFFKAVGLQENDAIRKVNSMRMVSQRRAEYFLSEFLKDRVSALVLDIEREGKPEKLIYLIR